jgi:molecular chaperone GrpE
MTDDDRPADGQSEEEARRVKVTDKRRVHLAREAQAHGGDPAGELEEAEGGHSAAELEEARAKAREYLDHLQRLQAEFDNYRKRVLREQTRAVDLAAEPLMRKLLEVLDEFDLALMAAEKQPDFDRFLHGVELVYAKLQEILRGEGLERIEAQGRPFDPARHEALLESREESGDPAGEPVVVDVLRPGYTLRGQVIRPAGVKVARR